MTTPSPRGLRSLPWRTRWLLVPLIALSALLYLWWGQDNQPAYELRTLDADPGAPLVVQQQLRHAPPETQDEWVPILVNLEDHHRTLHREISQALGITLEANSIFSEAHQLYRARVPKSQVDTLLRRLNAWPGVEYAEEKGTMALFSAPDDPLYIYQWNFEQVRAAEAWSLSTGKGVVVAVIDTGIAYEDPEHPKRGLLIPDLNGTRLVRGYDFVDDDPFPFDGHGHGTHVAGTIAQSTHNGYGVAGLAFNAALMPLRVLNNQGYGNTADIAEAIRFAADNGAQVINLSLGGPTPSRELDAAIRYAHARGVVIIAAAGNNGSRRPSYPAASPHVIAVAATQFDRSTTFYSNYGPHISLAAPGGNTQVDQNDDGRPDGILQETLRPNPDGSFQPVFASYMGTSMAAPHVAAAAAMLIANGISNPDQVRHILESTAADAGESGWDERFGHGILDIHAALTHSQINLGLWRLLSALALTALVIWWRRKERNLAPGPQWTYLLGFTLGLGILFALPLLISPPALMSPLLSLAARPLSLWGGLLLGPAESPLFASFLPVLLAAALFLGRPGGQRLVAGFAIATAAVLLCESAFLHVDVAYVPGVGLLDRLWLGGNGLLSLWIGALALKAP